MQRNSEITRPATPERQPIRAKLRNALGSITLRLTRHALESRQAPTPEALVSTSDPDPDQQPTPASQQQLERVAANLEANPLLDSPVSEEGIFKYMLSQTVLSDTLRENTTGISLDTYQETVLRDAFGLLAHFNPETGQPLPAAMNDTYLLAHAIDRTRNLQTDVDNPLSEDWTDLRTATRHLLEPKDGVDGFNPHATLGKAFDRAAEKNTDIIAEYKNIELGQYTVAHALNEGSAHQLTISEHFGLLDDTLVGLNASGTLPNTRQEREELSDQLYEALQTRAANRRRT